MFDVKNGYSKPSFQDYLEALTQFINQQFNTDYTAETIIGSNHFKSFYGGVQLAMEADNKIADLQNKVVDYIRTINESISAPISSPDGTVRYFKDTLGLDVALRPITDVSLAGKPAICVDTDPTAETFGPLSQQIFDALRISQTEGLYWYNPSTTPAANEHRGESSALNGQAFPYAFFTPNALQLEVRITVTRSRDNLAYQLNPTQIAELFNANFAKLYQLGRDFEGERYINVSDIPSAANVKVEWSTNGTEWNEGIREMPFDSKVIIKNVTVVEG